MGKRVKTPQELLKKDIRYRGPLSYRAFKLLGWLCVNLSAAVVLMNLASRVDARAEREFREYLKILPTFTELALPFFLLANFSIILDNKHGFKNLLLRNASAMLGVTAVYLTAFYRYFVGTLDVFSGKGLGVELATELMQSLTRYGFWDFNLFVDLFLCTAMMFFVNYRPRRFFQGKKLILFRLLAVLPVAYEAASLALKALCAAEKLVLPAWVNPLLTVKPPTTFIVFILLMMYLKGRERQFLRTGHSYGDFRSFLGTRRNSLYFSAYAALILFAAGITDSLMKLTLESISPDLFFGQNAGRIADAIGLGKASALTLLSPIMLLFSYTRRRKNRVIDLCVPLLGMGLMALMVIEALYRVVLEYAGRFIG